MGFNVPDALLTQTKTLPAGAAAVNSTGFDLGNSSRGDFLAGVELKIDAPALTVAQLVDADTVTYDVMHDTASDFSSEAVLYDNVIVQTGAGGAGAAAASKTVRLPVDVNRYIRIKATKTGAESAAAASLTETLLF